ncbi:MAG: hypothetical protein ABI333_29825 [bacterium]
MYLTGLMHRGELFDITLRWLNDDLHPEDGRRLTEIFLYESMVSCPSVQEHMLRFFQRLYGVGLSVERVAYKQQLRERLIECVPVSDPRIEFLTAAFRESPEEFFPRLPVDGLLLFAPEHRLVSISRIKRPQRVAEKAAYRTADALADLIRGEAELLASGRAVEQGVDLQQLISTQEQMRADFVSAERRVASGFRSSEIALNREDLSINDIIGFKVIGDEEELQWAERMLAEEPNVSVLEREVHRGHYNATNLQVDIDLPPVGQLVDEARDMDWAAAASRGLNPEEARRNFPRFVETGERTVRTEVILTTYPELIESELGRSLHERRILRLRERQSYSGQIAENARFLIEYLLAVAYAPTVRVSELPIKMWGRYLPETLVDAVRRLHGLEPNGVLLRSFTLSK